MDDQSTTPTSLSASSISDTNDVTHRICFLDLDDTLIPTTWMRNRYEQVCILLNTRAEKPIRTNGLNLSIYKVVKRELDEAVSGLVESRILIDDLVIEFLQMIADQFDTVVIVTNARSQAWVSAFHQTFPKLSAKLDELKIKIIKTNPLTPEPAWCTQPQDYFNYWSSAKLEEFEQVLLQLKSEGVRSFRMTCIGDNNFEHYAFIQLCERHRPHTAHIVKCTCGLKPRCFTRQISSMARCVQANPSRRRKYKEQRADAEGLFNVLLTADVSEKKHVQSLTWAYDDDIFATNVTAAVTHSAEEEIDEASCAQAAAAATTTSASTIREEPSPIDSFKKFFARAIRRP